MEKIKKFWNLGNILAMIGIVTSSGFVAAVKFGLILVSVHWDKVIVFGCFAIAGALTVLLAIKYLIAKREERREALMREIREIIAAEMSAHEEKERKYHENNIRDIGADIISIENELRAVDERFLFIDVMFKVLDARNIIGDELNKMIREGKGDMEVDDELRNRLIFEFSERYNMPVSLAKKFIEPYLKPQQ